MVRQPRQAVVWPLGTRMGHSVSGTARWGGASRGSQTSDIDRRLPCGTWRWDGGPGASSLARLPRFLLGEVGDITTVFTMV